MFIALLNDEDGRRADYAALRACRTNAAPLPPARQGGVRRARRARGAGRGLRAHRDEPAHPRQPASPARRPGSIGIPLPDTDARIVDLETGPGRWPPGEPGELLIRGPQVMRGYWKPPGGDGPGACDDGWLRTGDVAAMDADGYFRIVDRSKDVINTAGFKVWPREVEEALYAHPAVRLAAVVGRPRRLPGRGRQGLRRAQGRRADATGGRRWSRLLPRPAHRRTRCPRLVEFRAELPMTTTGKLLRRDCCARSAGGDHDGPGLALSLALLALAAACARSARRPGALPSRPDRLHRHLGHRAAAPTRWRASSARWPSRCSAWPCRSRTSPAPRATPGWPSSSPPSPTATRSPTYIQDTLMTIPMGLARSQGRRTSSGSRARRSPTPSSSSRPTARSRRSRSCSSTPRPTRASCGSRPPASARVDDVTVRFLEKKGYKMTTVPYPKPGERYAAALGGHAEVLYEQAGDVLQYLKAGQLQPLVIFADRAPPGVPGGADLEGAGHRHHAAAVPRHRRAEGHAARPHRGAGRRLPQGDGHAPVEEVRRGVVLAARQLPGRRRASAAGWTARSTRWTGWSRSSGSRSSVASPPAPLAPLRGPACSRSRSSVQPAASTRSPARASSGRASGRGWRWSAWRSPASSKLVAGLARAGAARAAAAASRAPVAGARAAGAGDRADPALRRR